MEYENIRFTFNNKKKNYILTGTRRAKALCGTYEKIKIFMENAVNRFVCGDFQPFVQQCIR